MSTPRQEIMIVAGEVSGDMHAGRLAAEISARRPGVSFFGIGGPVMRSAGVEVLHDISEMAVMGITEVLKRYGFFRRVFFQMLDEVRRRKPAAVILVDYPGFNLRFAERVHALGIPAIYFISPQVWAWHRSRIPKMARIIDRLLVIFPFEPEVFAGTGLPVTFVGHPLVDAAADTFAGAPAPLPWPGGRRIAMLPGSREHEIRRILPVLAEAAERITAAEPEAGFLLVAPSPEAAALGQALLDARPPGHRARWATSVGQAREALRQADAAVVASGTATVEAALMNCPMVVAYRVAPATYFLARRLVKVEHIGMVNIIAGRRLCPELVQHDATPERIAAELLRFLQDREYVAGVRKALRDEVAARLGPPGAISRAAEAVCAELTATPPGTRSCP